MIGTSRKNRDENIKKVRVEKTAGGARMASWIEGDNVHTGGGTCRLEPASSCLPQPRCLTPVKTSLLHQQSLHSFWQEVRRFNTPCMLCTAVIFVCAHSLSPRLNLRASPSVFVFPVPAYQIPASMCFLGCWQSGKWKTVCPKGKSGSEVQTWACQGQWIHSFPLASSCHVPLFTARLFGSTSKGLASARWRVSHVALSYHRVL